MKSSRYDKNKQLYDKVKNNDYDEYNQNIKDEELEFTPKISRKEYQEKKRLSVYFQDIDDELSNVNDKLNTLTPQESLEIKEDANLKALIEQAKKKQLEQGSQIFTNTQHEILDSLNVEETDDAVSLDDLVGDEEVEELDLDETSEELDLSGEAVEELDLDEVNEELDLNDEPVELDFSETETPDLILEENDVEEDFVEVEELDLSDEPVELDFDETEPVELNEEEQESDFEDDSHEEIADFDEIYDDGAEDEVTSKETVKKKSSLILTFILVLLIILLVGMGLFIASNYIGVL